MTDDYKARAEKAEARLEEAMGVIRSIFDPTLPDDALHIALSKLIKSRLADAVSSPQVTK